ncbi:uncharacterized protein LOC120327838 [Styela clava]
MPRSWQRKEGRFLVKYQILAKDQYVLVVLSLDDPNKESEEQMGNGYKQIDRVVTVDLPRKTCTAHIESIDGSADIKPSNGKSILHSNLRVQACVLYMVALKAPSSGDHSLQLRFRSGDNDIHIHPFHVTLEEETYTDLRRAKSKMNLAKTDDIEEALVPNLQLRPEQKFPAKYQILTQGPLVVVVYTVQDIAQACQELTASGYKIIESGARSGTDVQLPRFWECTSSIESSDSSVEVSPRFEMPLVYTDLKNQTAIQHQVTLLTSSGGRHLLKICLKREGEIFLLRPFHVELGPGDLNGNVNLAAHDGPSTSNDTELGNRQLLKQEEKFLVNYQILTKGSWVVVIYSLGDTTNACRQLISSGYQCIEHGTSNHQVRFRRWSPCTSRIESMDGSVIVKPAEGKELSYDDLKNQKSVRQSVTLLAESSGTHLLQLCIRNVNEILHSAPFQVTLEDEDLYAVAPASKPQLMRQGAVEGQKYAVTAENIYDDIGVENEKPRESQPKGQKYAVTAENIYDDIGVENEKPRESQPKVTVGVTQRLEQQQSKVKPARKAPRPTPRTVIHDLLPIPFRPESLENSDNEWDDDSSYEDIDGEGTGEMQTVDRPQFPTPLSSRFEQHDANKKPVVDHTEKNALRDFSVRRILEKHNVDNYWPLLEKSGIKSAEDLAQLDKKKLEEFGVKTVGDRIRIMNAVESCKSPSSSSNTVNEENFAVNELLEKVGMINFNSLFEKERISLELLNVMKDQDFKDVGITQENDRKAIKQALEVEQGYCDLERHQYEDVLK